MTRRIYVETSIDAPMEVLWQRSQDPAQHSRWDLRFGEIRALAPSGGSGAEMTGRFSYATTVLPGLTVAGTGVHAGERHRRDGSCTSALQFSCSHPLSIIRTGSGYWRYRPQGRSGAEAGGITFLTGYDYEPGWGWLGPLADRLIFRPLIGWATAWSFDRLRLWCERGISPERSRNQALAELTVRAAAVLAAVAIVGAEAAGNLAGPDIARSALASGLAIAITFAAIAVPPRATTPAARRTRRWPAPAQQRPRRDGQRQRQRTGSATHTPDVGKETA